MRFHRDGTSVVVELNNLTHLRHGEDSFFGALPVDTVQRVITASLPFSGLGSPGGSQDSLDLEC